MPHAVAFPGQLTGNATRYSRALEPAYCWEWKLRGRFRVTTLVRCGAYGVVVVCARQACCESSLRRWSTN